MSLTRNQPTPQSILEKFSSEIDFKLPKGYIEFMSVSNGAEGELSNSYLILWPIEELVTLNQEYQVDEFAPGFFIIGSNGGDTAFAINKQTGELYDMPFIGMSKEEANLLAKDFTSFIENLGEDV